RERLLADAKEKVLSLAPHYQAPAPSEFRLGGASARAAFAMAVDGLVRTGKATAHDRTVATRLANVLSGGEADPIRPVGEDALLTLEREGFSALIRTGPTLARIERMLETGKPLRN